MPKYITDNAKIDENFDEENSDKENFDEKNIVKNKCVFWKSNFKNVFFEREILKISFLREKFWKCSFYGNYFKKKVSWLFSNDFTVDYLAPSF